MRLSDIVKHITKLFEKKRKNPIQLETDSNLESNLKFLKVSDKSTPIQISEDKVNVEGNLTVNGSDVITESSDVDSLDDLSDVSYSSGDLEITSLDTIVAGDLAIDSSGDIELNADGGNILFADGAVELVEMTTSDTKFYFPSGDTADYLSISVAARGQATLATQDSSDAEQGHIILTAEGDVQLDPSTGKTVLQDSTLYVEEQANANAEYGFGGYGQIWVKNSTPNELYFTTDAGDDIQITSGTAISSPTHALNDLSDVTYSSGDLTISSLDTIVAASLQLTLDDGDLGAFKGVLDGQSNTFFQFGGEAGSYSSFIMNETGGDSNTDYFKIDVLEHGATTLATVDGAAAVANLTLDVDGKLILDAADVNIHVEWDFIWMELELVI